MCTFFSEKLGIAPQVLGVETLDECVNCLVEFGCNVYTDISLDSIVYLEKCTKVARAREGLGGLARSQSCTFVARCTGGGRG